MLGISRQHRNPTCCGYICLFKKYLPNLSLHNPKRNPSLTWPVPFIQFRRCKKPPHRTEVPDERLAIRPPVRKNWAWRKFVHLWLVVSTHLKNIRQIGHLPQIGVKIWNIWNHHLVIPSWNFLIYTSLSFPFVLFQSFNIDMLKWCSWSDFFKAAAVSHLDGKPYRESKKNLIPIPAMSMGQRIHQLFEMWLWCVPSQLVSIGTSTRGRFPYTPILETSPWYPETELPCHTQPKDLRVARKCPKNSRRPYHPTSGWPKITVTRHLRHLWVNFHVHLKECKQLNSKTLFHSQNPSFWDHSFHSFRPSHIIPHGNHLPHWQFQACP